MKKLLAVFVLLAAPAFAARDTSGNYSIPNPPFVTGTPISSSVMNGNFSDLATAMTDSLSRTGHGGMLSSFFLSDGSAATPGLAFTNEQTTGFYRKSAGTVCLSLISTETYCWNSTLLTQNTFKIANYFDMMFFFPGRTVNSQVFARLAMTGTTILKAGLPAAVGFAGTGPAGSSATITLNKRTAGGVTTVIGTFVWNAAAQNVSTVTFTADITFAAGDFLELVNQATADTAMADVSITLQARRQ